MCAGVDGRRPQTILELGAGTGAVTSMILRRMHPDSRLFSVEIDPEMAAIVEQRCPRATVLRADASTLRDRLGELGIDRVDQFINCLPTPSLPKATNRAVLECWRDFADGCAFTQLTVMPWVYLRTYQRVFEQVRFRLVPLNLPPAGVYHCHKLRTDYADPVRLPGPAEAA